MKVFVDARWTRTDHHDGVSRYGANMINELHKIQPITILIHNKDQLKLLPRNVPYVVVNHPISLSELQLPKKLNQLGAEVVFSPLQYMGLWGKQYKLILTVHDLIYYRHPTPPSYLSWFVRIVWRVFHIGFWPQRLILNKSDAVVTVSKTSKNYIQQHNITNKPITVAYNAASKLRVIHKKPTKKLVYMGSFMPYKNVELLIAAMELLPDYELHLLSKIPPAREKELIINAPKDAPIFFYGGVTEAEYAEILSDAHALVTASLEEGFGLPLVEAMQAGVPVICSDIDIFHEVVGEGGLFFDPHSKQDFADKTRQLQKSKLRSEMIKKGKAQAKKFTWKKSARSLDNLIQQLGA
jgi:glycosyltransferase involved in cell wall biosynthesis